MGVKIMQAIVCFTSKNEGVFHSFNRMPSSISKLL